MRKYINAAILYSVLGLGSGVFYREFTKIMDFTGATRLSLIHGHYISLGLFVFLLLMLLDKQFDWSSAPKAKGATLAYHIGLNITALGFAVRGVFDVLETPLSKGLNASISGISGIGHMILGISLVLILLKVRSRLDAKSRDER